MTKSKHHFDTAAEAVRAAIAGELAARPNDLKPVEIVKTALSAYQSYTNREASASTRKGKGGSTPVRRTATADSVESEDRAAFRRGRQDALDRVLFNVNYWRAAYEDRIVDACSDSEDAKTLLVSISTWNSHTMRLNTLSFEQTQSMFKRFCPPLCENNRRGGRGRSAGKGPVPDFLEAAHAVIDREGAQAAEKLARISSDVKAEAEVYGSFEGSSLDAMYDLLPVWCLQNRIELVSGDWWEDADVMLVIAEALRQRFLEMGFAVPLCDNFYESVKEAMEDYERDVTSSWDEWQTRSVPELLSIVRKAREVGRAVDSNFEIDGYGPALPAWLSSKEQLVWNIVVCSVFGPIKSRPFLPEAELMSEDSPERLDVITDMARSAYGSYVVMSAEQGDAPAYTSFESQPEDLRSSMLAQVESIHDKLAVLGYHIVPSASCYPEQRIDSLTPSEIDCLAILEHRRWLAERKAAGWTYGSKKDVSAKQTPYLVEWEELPDRARERNRSAVRIIPSFLASVGLAISR